MADERAPVSRLTFESMIDKVTWALLTAGVAMIVHSLGDLKKHVSTLNDQTLILVERSSTYQKNIEEMNGRIQSLEAWRQAVILAQPIQIQAAQPMISGASPVSKNLIR